MLIRRRLSPKYPRLLAKISLLTLIIEKVQNTMPSHTPSTGLDEATQLTGAEIIAHKLAQYGIRHVFGIVSIHNMPIFDAINRLGYTQIVDSRHECAATHSADGYARASGGVGVVIASTGPGTTNTVTGLYEAAYASSRVLLITGQVERQFYGKGAGYVHEAEQQVAMLRSVARRVESARDVSQLGDLFDMVIKDMSAGRWQPGALEVPIDVQYAHTIAGSSFLGAELGAELAGVDRATASAHEADLSALMERINATRRRLILVGGGAQGAAAEVRQLAERLGAPVLTTLNGRGVLPEDHPLCVGNFYHSRDLAAASADAELTLAIGTRFQAGVDGRNRHFVPPGDLVHIDVDGGSLGRVHRAAQAIQADAQQFLGELNQHLEPSAVDASDGQFTAAIIAAGNEVKAKLVQQLGDDFRGILQALTDSLAPSSPVVRDNTIAAYFMANQLLPIRTARVSITPTSGAIGPGLPLGIGAAQATGERTLVIHGDGGFMFHATELATAVQQALPLTVCVFNDGGYGILRRLQANKFDGRINETDLGFMDFAAMAKSMGCDGERVASVAAFTEALGRAQSIAGPYLIDVDLREIGLIGGMMAAKDLEETALSQ